MLKPNRLITVIILSGAVVIASGLLGWLSNQRSAVLAPTPVSAAPGPLAEVGGLTVLYDPNYSGLTIATSPALSSGMTRTVPSGRREVVRLEPRALVAGNWMTVAPSPDRLARPTVRREGDTVIIQLDELVLGDSLTTSWTVKLGKDRPSLTIERTDHILRPGDVSATALVAITASNRAEERLVLVSGTAYTLTERSINRLGSRGYSGLVSRDLAVSFLLDTADATRITGERQGDRDQFLLVTERPANAPSSSLQTTTQLYLGPRLPLQTATSTFNPTVETFLLTAGYYGNVFISEQNKQVMTASMKLYPDSVWIRDVAAASRGYLYVLDDDRSLQTFRNTLVQFLRRTDMAGVVPEYFNEAGKSENRQAWDAMPDLIHAVYAYVSRTQDTRLVAEYHVTLQRVAGWIRQLDSDGDGLPDRDIFPYGYFDSVENGVMHTYAIASFYTALHEMAELNELIGVSGQEYRDYAARMRDSFNRPVQEGGYWQEQLGYPVAWKKSDGRIVTGFETFGVLAAVRVGLIADEERLRQIGHFLRTRRDEFVNGNRFPARLMIGGYDQALVRPGVQPENAWLLDANAPWVTALDVAVRAHLGDVDDALAMMLLYQETAGHYPPMPEFGASAAARHGPGDSRDGGRLWDNAAWFEAVYGTHYGILMTSQMLVVRPVPLRRMTEDTANGLNYQGLRFRLTLTTDGYTFTVLDGQSRSVRFYPVGKHRLISVNGEPAQANHTVVAQPGQVYRIQSIAGNSESSR